MRTGIFFLSAALLLGFVSTARAADIRQMFFEMPSESLKTIDRAAAIREGSNGFLKLEFPKGFAGEFKLLAEKKDETIFGFSVYSCDESALEVWSVKNRQWREITGSAAPRLGARDVREMLKVSPATIDKLGEEVSIPYFFTFSADTNRLKLRVRKQGGCEIAGTVYEYEFSGRKFSRK